MRFTAHLGEDCRDLLTGLRCVHEGLEFFGLRDGKDRIGHAAALGIDPRSWKNEQRQAGVGAKRGALEILMPPELYLENLAWEWRLHKGRHPDPPHSADYVTREFEKYVNPLFRNSCGFHPTTSHVTIDAWAESYRLAFLPQSLVRLGILETRADGTDNLWPASPTKRPVDGLSAAEEILRARLCCRKLHLAIQGTGEVAMRIDNKYLQGVLNLQAWLAGQIRKRSITVESCPTSNTHVLRLDEYAATPAIMFDDPRANDEAQVPFTINTDDPLVFDTTPEDEIASLCHVIARMRGRKQDPNEWIRRRCDTARATCFTVPASEVDDETHRAMVELGISALKAI